LLDEEVEISLHELCAACSTSVEWVTELVHEGVLDPDGDRHSQWRFTGAGLARARIARRLQRDLGINLPGVALALEMMEELASLRAQLRRLEFDDPVR
jgi:chaperone modulatory protein CbpM